MANIARNLQALKNQLNQASEEAGRNPADVVLVAVSKGQEFCLIRAAYLAGQRDFGENYAQEMVIKKQQAIKENLSGIKWHYLGAIQSNKLKLIIEADVIHSVSSVKQGELLSKIVSQPLDIFLQVNLDNNPRRIGFAPAEILSAINKLSALPKLLIKGLMVVLPQDSTTTPDFWCRKMVELKNNLLGQQALSEVLLSMGMSNDFITAITHGSNIVRIGAKIFGERPAPKT